MDAVALRIREIDPQARVVCAFLELTKPDLLEAVDTVVADGATLVTVLPMFWAGRHARRPSVCLPICGSVTRRGIRASTRRWRRPTPDRPACAHGFGLIQRL
jgi:hypothetical protein